MAQNNTAADRGAAPPAVVARSCVEPSVLVEEDAARGLGNLHHPPAGASTSYSSGSAFLSVSVQRVCDVAAFACAACWRALLWLPFAAALATRWAAELPSSFT